MPPAQKYEQFVGETPAKTPWYWRISRDTWLLLFTAFYMVVGLVYLHFHNDFQYLTAAYALIEIVTTVGYGDFDFPDYFDKATGQYVKTNFGKIFMSFYVMVGLTVIASVITKVAEKASEGAEKAFRAKMRRAQMKTTGMTEDQVKNKFGESNKALAAFFGFLFMVAFGTFFYGWYESCTCSYGRTLVAGCNESAGYDICVSTGGITKSYVDAFYMSCITLTTVGFGDFAPASELGRFVAIFWILIGVVVTGNFISEMTAHFIEAEKERKSYERISYDTFAEIDVDGNGSLSKYEFVSFVLLQYGLVKKEDLDEIIKMYEKLDVSGDGFVTYEDLELFNETMKSDTPYSASVD